MKENNKQTKISTGSGLRKSANKPVKKIQIMLNESQDMLISKTMRLFHNVISKTIKNKKKNKPKGIQKMKKTNVIKTLIISGILILPVLFGWKINEAAQKNTEFSRLKVKSGRENFEKNSEYFFIPAGDLKQWHIINRYASQNENDTLDCNNSVYLFSKDSVLVINDFISNSNELSDYVQEEIYQQK